jgi:hypothetical protein
MNTPKLPPPRSKTDATPVTAHSVAYSSCFPPPRTRTTGRGDVMIGGAFLSVKVERLSAMKIWVIEGQTKL